MSRPTTNDQFLDAIFGRGNTGVFTVSFRGPMSAANWSRNPFVNDAEANNYYCVSTLKDPSGRRTPDNCAALYVLLVDDVGTKVEEGRARGILGHPSYVVETSEGNYQWGYRLSTPITDSTIAESLVQAMVRCFTADAAGRNRVARLPFGTNGKNGFKTKLYYWAPDISLTPDAAWESLEAVPIEPSDLQHQDALPPELDPIITAMDLAGHPYESTRVAGIYKVQCPWVSTHTNGQDDGAAYISPSGFNCFHGHCADKTFRDFRSHFGVGAGEVDGAIAEREFGRMLDNAMPRVMSGEGFTEEEKHQIQVMAVRGLGKIEAAGAEVQPSTEVVDKATMSVPPLHPWLNETAAEFAHESGRFLSRAELQAKYPIEWLFEGIVPMGVPWCIAGEGGLGKSRIMLSLCMSIASGVPWGNEFIPGKPGGSPVIFLTQEDDKPQRGHRFITQYEYLCSRDARWKGQDVAERLQRNLWMPTVEWGQQLTVQFRRDFKSFLEVLPAQPALVVFDPLVLFWDHSDKETSINSAAGAINTMKSLIKMVRNNREHPFSVAICHHLSKAGEVYGSAILTANLRLVFSVKHNDAGKVEMRVEKVNGSNIKDKVYEIDRSDDGSAAVFPAVMFDFEELSDEARLAGLIHSEQILWDVRPSELVEKAVGTGQFKSRDALVQMVTPKGVWHKGTAGSAERLAKLGLEHAPHNRFRPIAGWSGE